MKGKSTRNEGMEEYFLEILLPVLGLGASK